MSLSVLVFACEEKISELEMLGEDWGTDKLICYLTGVLVGRGKKNSKML